MARTWADRLTSGGTIVSILIALIGQAVFSIVWQIRNNEQQEAKIQANMVAINTLRSEIVNLQTPLSAMVLKMEGRVGALEMQYPHMEKLLSSQDEKMGARLEAIDKGGTRELTAVIASITRLSAQTDRNSDRITATEKGITDLQSQITIANTVVANINIRLDKIVQVLDSAYDKLNELIRNTPPQRRPP